MTISEELNMQCFMDHIANLLQDHGFEMMKIQKLLIRGGPEDSEDMLFRVYVAREAGAVPP